MSDSNQLALQGTVFEPLYTTFNVGNDSELVQRLSFYAIISTVVIGIYSFFFPSPYGRFSTSWVGPKVNAKFAWMVQESPAYVIPLILMYQSPSPYKNNFPNILILLLFIVHYLQRSLVYPLKMTERARPVPILTLIMALVVCGFNGFLQSHHLLNVEKISNSACVIPGIILFTIGMTINIHHDGILVGLKKKKKSADSKSDYQIPTGGLFQYVSGANYLGEIIEWWGFALASSFRVPQLIFAIFSTVYLGTRAWHNHSNYKKTFGKSYPANRKAIFPYLI